MRISVNILTWNNFNTLHDTLHNLKSDLKDMDYEVIIIDNGSNDLCAKAATIANPNNLGISKAKNQGIEASKGEFILLLDGDVVYMPNSIQCLTKWLEDNPKEYAIGFYPNKFTNQKGLEEKRCDCLFEPKPYTATCLYYGMYRKTMFDLGIRCPVDGPFNKPGYGWEDRDFFYQMKQKGITQWVAGINTAIGKYYHAINSSIKEMGHEEYIRSSKERAEYFKAKWIN